MILFLSDIIVLVWETEESNGMFNARSLLFCRTTRVGLTLQVLCITNTSDNEQ